MGLIDQLVFTNLEKSFNAIFQQTNLNNYFSMNFFAQYESRTRSIDHVMWFSGYGHHMNKLEQTIFWLIQHYEK